VDSTVVVDVVIVNQRLEKLIQLSTNKYQLYFYQFSLDLLDPTTTDTIFRVYYRYTDPNNCMRSGHGDILRR
jgi:hypothetical protein